jgi:histidine decarboxylase
VEGLRQRTQCCLDIAAYAEKAIREVEPLAWRNPSTLTINIPKPEKAFIKKWQIASENNWAHIICMPGMHKEQIDAFVKDLQKVKTDQLQLTD